MKQITFMIVLLFVGFGCNGQEKTKKYNYKKADTTAQNKPQVSWKVNREIDNQGNIIKYDSTYTWSYSRDGAIGQVQIDSVLNMFKKNFDIQFNNVFRESFGEPVWNDSLFYKTFTEPNYFMQKWKNKELNLENFIHQMDSARNAFLQSNFLGLEEPSGKKK